MWLAERRIAWLRRKTLPWARKRLVEIFRQNTRRLWCQMTWNRSAFWLAVILRQAANALSWFKTINFSVRLLQDFVASYRRVTESSGWICLDEIRRARCATPKRHSANIIFVVWAGYGSKRFSTASVLKWRNPSSIHTSHSFLSTANSQCIF